MPIPYWVLSSSAVRRAGRGSARFRVLGVLGGSLPLISFRTKGVRVVEALRHTLLSPFNESWLTERFRLRSPAAGAEVLLHPSS